MGSWLVKKNGTYNKGCHGHGIASLGQAGQLGLFASPKFS